MRTETGHSLIEVMVACSIIGVVLATTTTAIAFGIHTVADARRSAEAERVAAYQLELLLKKNREREPVLEGSQRYDQDGRASGEGGYLASWVVEPNRPIAGAGRVVVSVGFRGATGRERAIRLVSYLSGDAAAP